MDTKSKKIEVNHTLFQQNRLSAVNRFFERYSKAVALWKHILIYRAVSREYSTTEMDELIFPTLIELDSSIFELMVFFNDPESKKIEMLGKNIWLIHKKLSNLYLENESVMTHSEKPTLLNCLKVKCSIRTR